MTLLLNPKVLDDGSGEASGRGDGHSSACFDEEVGTRASGTSVAVLEWLNFLLVLLLVLLLVWWWWSAMIGEGDARDGVL
jgi:hypothetical protein